MPDPTPAPASAPAPEAYTYIVEHLDPELGPWSELEYACIARETQASSSSTFCLSSLPPSLEVPEALLALSPAFGAETRGVEDLYPGPEDKRRVCLLDPHAERDLCPEDAQVFAAFLFGGILGDDPPRDRTSELRKKGFEGRRLGPVQMTTDTAVRVTRMVIEEQYTLNTIRYVDFPELKFNEHESTQMPFRYVKGPDGKPIMPDGMVDLIKKDADKSIDDLF
ncbi:hypothetical protein DL766_002111 [Monosporascus sp. MC13-8B]|nr:hypothetical protein DL763_007089 [Monosporascus cannonballus]RYP36224.1 hypothetical protein DL766_002111 [Monosporascus sp. MC13-8B]